MLKCAPMLFADIFTKIFADRFVNIVHEINRTPNKMIQTKQVIARIKRFFLVE